MCKFVIYADDTTLLTTYHSLDDLFEKTNSVFWGISSWFYDNRLAIILLKTNYILFHVKQSMLVKELLNNVSLERKEYTKFLGIVIDANSN